MDDFIFSGSALFMDNVAKSVKKKFETNAECKDRLTHTGLQIYRNANFITVSQKQDNNMKQITIPDDAAMTDPLDNKQQRDLKSLAGKLN